MLRRILVSIMFVSAVTFAATACSVLNVTQTSKPSVVITSPPSGSQFAEGDDVIVKSTATDSSRVVRFEFVVDGVTVAADSAPVAQGGSSFSVAFAWKAVTGNHTIVVRAVNAAGLVSEPVGVTVSVQPASAPTSTPVAEATTAPTEAPTVAPTPTAPAVGAVNGQVTFQFPDDNEKPAANARVEVLGVPSASANADNNGKYNLAQVPAGSQLVFAKNQFGESNPVEVLVPGGGTRNVNIRLLPGGSNIGAPTRIYTGRVTRNGQPVPGAYVWVHGDLGVTTTNREGRYWLVHWVRKEIDGVKMRSDPLFIVATDGTHWNGVYRAENPQSPTPDIELNRNAPPSPPRVIYDLVADAGHAAWKSSNGTLAFSGNPNDQKGSARYLSNAVLEDKASPDRVLEVFPAKVSRGYVAGVFPIVIDVQKTDFLYGIAGFADGTKNANVTFSVSFVPKGGGSPEELKTLSADSDGQLSPFAVPLNDLAGKSGQIELRAFIGNQVSDANRAVWVEVKVVRGQ